MKIVLLALIVATALGLHSVSAAATDSMEVQAQQIFGEIMSPFCPGRLLNDCPSSAASELKDKIRSDLQGGKSVDQIEQELVAMFGNTVRATPSAAGFGWFAWLMPVFFVGLGALVLTLWLRGKRAADGPVVKSPPIDGELERRITEEMKDS